jgi:hypothetical protein
MRDNVDILPYDDHDRAVKLLHTLDHTVSDGKVKAILESKKYTTLMVNEVFSKLKSADVDHGLTARLESPTDSHSLALVSGKVAKYNANTSSMMYSLSSLMSLLDEEFDVLGEDELALLTRRFERLHKNKHKDERWLRKKDDCGRKARAMVRVSDVNSSSAYSSSSSSSSEDEGDQRKNKKASKNLSGLRCFAGDGFCGMACSSDSKKSHQSDSNLASLLA